MYHFVVDMDFVYNCLYHLILQLDHMEGLEFDLSLLIFALDFFLGLFLDFVAGWDCSPLQCIKMNYFYILFCLFCL